MKEICLQLILAIKYLHEKNIVNLNISPNNIVFSANGQTLKLVDLGLSNYLINFEDKRINGAQMKRCPSTLRYHSPEQILGEAHFKSDVWGFGCVILQMCTGIEPYDKIADN